MSHSLYGSAQPTDQPTLRYTQPHGPKSSYESGHINSTGHTLRVQLAHELEHPVEWVAPWVRSVPMESLDSPRSVHVASHEELHGIDHTNGLQCSHYGH